MTTNYNIPRSSLILQYGGESNPLISGLPDNHGLTKEAEKRQYMNRRVEFLVSRGGESDMIRPEGPNAGNDSPRSSRKGTKYSGNPGSGYTP